MQLVNEVISLNKLSIEYKHLLPNSLVGTSQVDILIAIFFQRKPNLKCLSLIYLQAMHIHSVVN